jgi:hypothetical protein
MDNIKNDDSDNDKNHRSTMTYKKKNLFLDEFKRHHVKIKKLINNEKKKIEIKRQLKNENKKIIYKNNSDFNKFSTLKRNDKKYIEGLIPKYEIKSSYSIERPEYNISTLKIEKGINSLKNKLISEKRNQIEIKKSVEDFGKNRAMYKSNLNKRHEIKNIIKEFKGFQHSCNNTKDISINTKETQRDDIDKDNEKKEETIKINKIHLNDIKNMNNDSLLITSLQYNNNRKKKSNSIDYIDNYMNDTVNEKHGKLNLKYIKSKILMRNKEENEISEPKESNEIIVDIHCELPKIKSAENVLTTKKDENDALMKSILTNPLFSSKRKVLKLCSVRDRNNNLNNRSNYSLSNATYMNNNNNRSCDSYEHRNYGNVYEYAKHKLISSMDYNYLHVKKGFNAFKRKDFLKLTKVIKDNDHYATINKTALYDAFIDPKNNNVYSHYYLPKYDGNNLLQKIK